jgi:hypothetical protein
MHARKEMIDVKAKFRNVVISIGLTLFLLIAALFQTAFLPEVSAQQNTPQPIPLKVSTRNTGGAFELTYDTLLYGDLKVYLPDDMSAGDTISGTVVVEPKGNTEEERAKNQDTLKGYTVEIGEQKASVANPHFMWTPPTPKAQQPVRYMLRLVEIASGREVANTTLPVLPTPPSIARPQTITPNDFILPSIGQQGRLVEIAGPFDGNLSNTALNWTKERNATGNTETSTEKTSGEFDLLAESPRKCVFMSPGDVTGPLNMNLNEKTVAVKGLYRSVGVGLGVGKRQLAKGESTTLTIMLRGLEGMKQSALLQLVTTGVVTMDGGNTQFVPILPTLIPATGVVTLTRTLTGQQAGGFAVTATIFVKPLDACLQDEEDGSSFLFNSATGDYIFAQLGGTSGSGKGSITKKGCTISLKDASPDRKVQATVDTCDKKGSATVQIDSTKTKFTITDKNTSDNTCAAR